MTVVTPEQKEKRRAIRIQHRELKIMYDGLSDWVDVRSPDLSPEGLFINTPHDFAPGTRLKLRFDLPHTGTLVQAVGEVRWCLPGIGAGVEFITLPDFARASIEAELEEVNKE